MADLHSSLSSTHSTLDNITNNTDIYEEHFLSMHTLVIVVVPVLVMIILAVGGNAMVLLSYANDNRLHIISNLYLVHLAVCDTIIGICSMPLNFYLTIHNKQWHLGKAACKVFLFIDYATCLQSVLLVILISIDRLVILRKGILYATVETRRKVHIKISLTWLISILLYGPAIFGWDHWVGSSSLAPVECHVEYYTNPFFTSILTVLDTVIPVIVLITVNGVIFWEVRKRIRMGILGSRIWRNDSCRSELSKEDQSTSEDHRLNLSKIDLNAHCNGDQSTSPNCRLHSSSKDHNAHSKGDQSASENCRLHSSKEDLNAHSKGDQSTSPNCRLHSSSKDPAHSKGDQSASENCRLHSSKEDRNVFPFRQYSDNATKQNIDPMEPGASKPNPARKQILRRGRDTCEPNEIASIHRRPTGSIHSNRKSNRSAWTLFWIVFTLVITWTPFSLSTVIFSICDACLNKDVLIVTAWILLLKSSINPFLYAFTITRFRLNFARILNQLFCCRRSRRKRQKSFNVRQTGPKGRKNTM